jgi:predicted nucleic acid-binding Zn ribbon protein
MRGELRGMRELLGPTLARLGVTDLDVLLAITEEWNDLAGQPWAEHSTPVILRRKTLVVEAATPMAVRLLRYGAGDLLGVLAKRFGPDVVEEIDVVAPSR